MKLHEKMDAETQTFFVRELERIKAQSYDIQYPERNARRLIPVSFDAGEGTEVITYRQYDRTGIAQIISDPANDFQRADVSGKEFSARVKSLGLAFGWSLPEIRASQQAGVGLDQRRADACRKGVLDKEHSLALFGDEDHNLQGLFTNPNISEFAIPARCRFCDSMVC